MTEPTPEAQAAQPETQEPQDTTDWKSEARKWEERAKQNRAAQLELERQRQASMSEAEKAVAEAEARGAATTAAKYGQRLARSDFVAAAAKRNPGYDASAILDDLNLGRYVGEDGEPDSKAIEKAVERLIPEASTGPAPLDLGVKPNVNGGPTMTQLIRRAAGRA